MISDPILAPADPVAPLAGAPRHVVGIGASAGGLEALEAFFGHMPADTGLAFVVIQHLSPDFKSLMNELLARHTGMPIHRVEDGMAVEPNAIYLIPPRKEMIIASGRLLLTDSDPSHSFSLPIDVFFRSLAQDLGRRAIGIVLSGTGTDGSRGICDIHQAGGLVLVQSEDTARFDGMPRAAIATGVADLIMPVEEMTGALLRFVADPQAPPRLGTPELAETPSNTTIAKLFNLLRHEYNIDFSQYKPTTVGRRIERRMVQNQFSTIDDYFDWLQGNRSELDILYRDLLIGVTQFFRDPEAFEILRDQVVPQLIERASLDQGVRVWVPGCATGEEAFSIAMLFDQAVQACGRPIGIKIFATDVHPESLERCSTGLFAPESVASVPPAQLGKYFVRQRDHYQISAAIRRLVVFAKHDVMKDPPFTKLDLISCRNLLIYLQSLAQEKVVSLFHFALKRNGILFLGPSETAGRLQGEFDVVNARWQLYRKRRDAKLGDANRFALRPPLAKIGDLPQPLTVLPSAAPSVDRGILHAYDTLLDRFMPAALLLDERGELVHAFGDAAKYLRPISGRFKSDVMSLVEGDLRIAIAAALPRVRKSPQPVVYNGVKIAGVGGSFIAKLTVECLPETATGQRNLLVMFEEAALAVQPPAGSEEFDPTQESSNRITGLERELQYTKESLQATVQELETSNEELQATNEELMASNEELQSTNEELHSVNEELYTVNAEHRRKIDELTQLTADMDNLLSSTEIGTIFLDAQLRIRKFTPSAAGAFNLLDRDVGRPLDHVTHQIVGADVIRDVHTCLRRGEPLQDEVRDRTGRWLLLRILPYRARPDVVDGVVITIVDLTESKQAQAALEDSERRNREQSHLLSMIIGNMKDGVVVVDRDEAPLLVNPAARRLLAIDPSLPLRDSALGHGVAIDGAATPSNPLPWSQLPIARALAGALDQEVEVGFVTPARPDPVVVSAIGGAITDDAGTVRGALVVLRDISERKRAEQALRQAHDQLEARVRARTAELEDARQRAVAASEAKSQFLARMSHELRTPLNAILGFSETMSLELLGRLTAQYREYAAFIHASGEQLLHLINDLLDLSRIEAGKVEFNQERIDLADAVGDAVSVIDPFALKHEVTIDQKIAPGDLALMGDRRAMRQMLCNLLSNAVKYSHPGQTVSIDVVRDDGGEASVRVHDRGIGIAAKDLPRVLEPFGQVTNPMVTALSGTGLGLSIVRSLIEMHGGRIALTSALGIGTTAALVFPSERVVRHRDGPPGGEGLEASPPGQGLHPGPR